MVANSAHPSIGRPFRWIVVGGAAETPGELLGPDVARAGASDVVEGDAIVLDWMAASYAAPGIMPRPHAIVVRAREQRTSGLPAFIVVTASYPSIASERPSGVEMARSEGRLVGDAIVVARSAGIALDTAIIEYALFERMAQNEQIDVEIVAREFLAAAAAALKSTTTR